VALQQLCWVENNLPVGFRFDFEIVISVRRAEEGKAK